MDFYFLGDEELVTAFRFIGIEGMAVKNSTEAIAAFRRITEGENAVMRNGSFERAFLPDFAHGEENCHLLLMTEETADWLGNIMIDWQIGGRYPLIVEIPGIYGRLQGRKTLVEAIREAIGIHI